MILWDIGNVCVRWDPRNLYRKLFAGEDAMERFLGEVCTMDWHGRNDAGEPMSRTCADLAAAHPEYAEEIHAWRTRWPEMFAGQISESVALIEDFARRGLTQAALTNFPAEKWPEFEAAHGWVRHFSDVVVSGREGVRKPDPAVYALTERRIGAAPEAILFIDDSPANIAAAAARGYDAVLYEGPDALRRELGARGLA